MASTHPINGVEGYESFSTFFEHWLKEQDRDLQSLLSVASSQERHVNGEAEDEKEHRIIPLIERVISHYENYYKVKSASAKRDILTMFTPTWTSSTENLFLWIGGSRPSTAIHLLYSKSGLQVESQLAKIARGVPTGDLADLSPAQMNRIERVQRETIRLERKISEEQAVVHETVADAQMVELIHAVSVDEEAMETGMRKKREGMQRVLDRADQLRMKTLKGLVEILRPMQAVHFLIAAAELNLRLHEFGKSKDESGR